MKLDGDIQPHTLYILSTDKLGIQVSVNILAQVI